MANRLKRMAKKRARREKRLAKRVAYHRITAPLQLGLPKMSALLLDFAAPLLGQGLRAHEARPLITFAAAIWNVARIIDEAAAEDANDLLNEIIEELAGDTDQSRAECEKMVGALLDRKRLLFGDDPRFVISVEVVDTPDGIHVMAASRL